MPDVAAASAYLAVAMGADQRAFAIVVDDATVGGVTVSALDLRHRIGWFSYWLGDMARGRGFAAPAAAAVANWALTDGGLFRLELGHRVENVASGRVAERAGFTPEGLERAKFVSPDGGRRDVRTMARLAVDPVPATDVLPILGSVAAVPYA